MTISVQTNLNPMITPLGKGDDGRFHYSVLGEKINVGEHDKDRFEKHASAVIDGQNKYYEFKANHSVLNGLRALAQVLVLAGGALGGAAAATKCIKKSNIARGWKYAISTLGGFTGFVLSGQITRYLNPPGYLQMKQNGKNLATVDWAYDDPSLNRQKKSF